MKSRIFLCTLLCGSVAFAQIQESTDSAAIELEGAEIIQKLPITTEKITKKELNLRNLGQDIPTLLQQSTSVVMTSDAGAGIGYSSIRIRGIEQDHINITMDGVPLNDPESQGVFWVNMPDLSTNTKNINIQRGVGTSSSGSGAFGAVINIESDHPSKNPFLESANSWGSFATQKYSLKGGTGEILNGKVALDIHASWIRSDGYIDRASSDLFSYGMQLNYQLTDQTQFRYRNFYGNEKTYQAWNGIDKETMQKNRRYNFSGIYTDDEGKVQFYSNETDNYQQNHNHLVWDQRYQKGWKSSTTLFLTRGKGYYENYKEDETLSDYLIDSELETSDLVRQKWLDNHFYGVNFNLENQDLGKTKFFAGFAVNQFKNDHFGKVIWIKDFLNQNVSYEYYRNESEKSDISAFAKILYDFGRFEIFGDAQYRMVNYQTKSVAGGDNPHEAFFPFKTEFHFFNPKFGINYFPAKKLNFYLFYGLAHREPIRSDYLDNGKILKPERLHDFELGFKKLGDFTLNANLFYMYYLDQLIATGALNDVGEFIRTNSGKSYRAGIEISTRYEILRDRLNLFGNITYSQNKNLHYREISYNQNGEEILTEYGNTYISFSPNWIGNFGLDYYPLKSLQIQVTNKFVGKQFMTNTELSDAVLESYFLTDFVCTYAPNWFKSKNFELNLLINNIFDVEYESNGFYYEVPYYYPQAGINILGGFKLRL